MGAGLDSKGQKVTCQYCGNEARLVEEKEVYGKTRGFGPVWFCNCVPGNAYVGCHKGTTKPLGELASPKLRYWRMRAHKAFDPIHSKTRGEMTRTQAYDWMSSRLNIPAEKCHIAMMDEETCQAVERLCHGRRGMLGLKTPKSVIPED